MNKRIKEVSPGVFHEALADVIKVSWNPIHEEVSINFESSTYLRMGDTYVSRITGDTGVSLTGEEFAGEGFEINGKFITGQDVDIFTRLLYDKRYNEQSRAQEESDELPEESEELEDEGVEP